MLIAATGAKMEECGFECCSGRVRYVPLRRVRRLESCCKDVEVLEESEQDVAVAIGSLAERRNRIWRHRLRG